MMNRNHLVAAAKGFHEASKRYLRSTDPTKQRLGLVCKAKALIVTDRLATR